MAKISPWQAHELKNTEALRLQTYDDATGLPVPVGGVYSGVLTIGYGHTGPDVTPGRLITQVTAEELFLQDVGRFERGVEASLRRAATQEQFDAMVSLAYNVGIGQHEIKDSQGNIVQKALGFRGSTVLKEFNADREDRIANAAVAFIRWNKYQGRVNEGLVNRRAREIVRFMGGWKKHDAEVL